MKHKKERVKCHTCHRRIPIQDGRLVRHWLGRWLERHLLQVGVRRCPRSGMTAQSNHEAWEQQSVIF